MDIDRLKAEALGVSFSTVTTGVSTAFGSAMVNDYVNRGRVQKNLMVRAG